MGLFDSATLGTLYVRYAADLSQLTEGGKQAQKQLTEQQKWIVDHERALRGIGIAAGVVGTSVLAMATQGVSQYKDFESAAAMVNGIARKQGEEFDSIKDKARELGASTVYSATESMNAFYKLYSAGLDTNEVFEATPEIMKLAIATGKDFDSVAETVSVSIKALGMDFSDTTRVTDAIAGSIQATNLNMDRFSDAMTYATPIAVAMGMSIEDTATALGVLHDKGMMGSVAGTALGSSMTALMRPTDSFKESMRLLNVELSDVNPIGQTAESVVRKLADAGYTADMAMSDFGKRGGAALVTLLETLPEHWDRVSDAVNRSGNAQRMYDETTGTLAFSMDMLSSAIEEVFLNIGEQLGPKLKEFLDNVVIPGVDSINAFTKEHEVLAPWLVTTGTAFGGLATAGGAYIALLPSLVRGFASLSSSMATASPLLAAMPIALAQIGALGVAAFAGWQLGTLIYEATDLEKTLGRIGGITLKELTETAEKYNDFALKQLAQLEVQRKALAEQMQSMSDEELALAGDKYNHLLAAQDAYASSYISGLEALGKDEYEAQQALTDILGQERAVNLTDSIEAWAEYRATLIREEKKFNEQREEAQTTHDNKAKELLLVHNDELLEIRAKADKALEDLDKDYLADSEERQIEYDTKRQELLDAGLKATAKLEEDFKTELLEADEDNKEKRLEIQNDLTEKIKSLAQERVETTAKIELSYDDAVADAKKALKRKLEDIEENFNESITKKTHGRRKSLKEIEDDADEKRTDAQKAFDRKMEDLATDKRRKERDAEIDYQTKYAELQTAYKKALQEQADAYANLKLEKQKEHNQKLSDADLKTKNDLEKQDKDALDAYLKRFRDYSSSYDEITKERGEKLKAANEEYNNTIESLDKGLEDKLKKIDARIGETQDKIQLATDNINFSMENFRAKLEEITTQLETMSQSDAWATSLQQNFVDIEKAIAAGATAIEDWSEAGKKFKESGEDMATTLKDTVKPEVVGAMGNSWFLDAMANAKAAVDNNLVPAGEGVKQFGVDVTTGITNAETACKNADLNVTGITQQQQELTTKTGENESAYASEMDKYPTDTKEASDATIEAVTEGTDEIVTALERRNARIKKTREDMQSDSTKHINAVREQHKAEADEQDYFAGVMTGSMDQFALEMAEAIYKIDESNAFVTLEHKQHMREYIKDQREAVENNKKNLNEMAEDTAKSFGDIKEVLDDAFTHSWYPEAMFAYWNTTKQTIDKIQLLLKEDERNWLAATANLQNTLDTDIEGLHRWSDELIEIETDTITHKQALADAEAERQRAWSDAQNVARTNWIAEQKRLQQEELNDLETHAGNMAITVNGIAVTMEDHWKEVDHSVQVHTSHIKDTLNDMVGNSWYPDYMGQFVGYTEGAANLVSNRWEELRDSIHDSLADIKDDLNDAVGASWYTDMLESMRGVTSESLKGVRADWILTRQDAVLTANLYRQMELQALRGQLSTQDALANQANRDLQSQISAIDSRYYANMSSVSGAGVGSIMMKHGGDLDLGGGWVKPMGYVMPASHGGGIDLSALDQQREMELSAAYALANAPAQAAAATAQQISNTQNTPINIQFSPVITAGDAGDLRMEMANVVDVMVEKLTTALQRQKQRA